MEKMIIQLMETAMSMETDKLIEEKENIMTSDYPFRYLMKEVLQNEINRRNGTRHLPLDKVKKYMKKRRLPFDWEPFLFA